MVGIEHFSLSVLAVASMFTAVLSAIVCFKMRDLNHPYSVAMRCLIFHVGAAFGCLCFALFCRLFEYREMAYCIFIVMSVPVAIVAGATWRVLRVYSEVEGG